ncbi:MAG: alpha/beta hydrolase-fold protein [Actinomycetes bacterium]
MVTRRTVITAGAAGCLSVAAAAAGGYGLIERGVLPGRIRLNQLLGRNQPPPAVPTTAVGALVQGSFWSRMRGTEVNWSLAYPPGHRVGDELAVCLALHGRYEDNAFPFATLHLDSYLAKAVEDGVPPFALASIDGGSATNWHHRASGDDPQAMIVDEFIPLLRNKGLSTDTLGLWGWSLGGYGALLLATDLPHRQVGPVVATSPALWLAAEDTAPDVFDDAADFARNNVFDRLDEFADVQLRIDIGDNDSFTPNVEQFIAALPEQPSGGVTPGFHDAAYWMRAAPDEIAFIGRRLAGSA